MDKLEKYLKPTAFIDWDNKAVKRKARELTRGLKTDREKAVALYYFVRDQIRHNPYAPGFVPEDYKASLVLNRGNGYCQHKALLLVALARAAGIPARLAVGFASGDFDPANNRYLVSEANAHSWPEIYFPNIGWVEFEPTGSLPEAQRPPPSAAQLTPEAPTNLLAEFQASRSAIKLITLAGLLGISGLALVIYIAWSGWHYRKLSPDQAIIHLYRRFYSQAQPLAQPLPQGHTPLELAGGMERWLARQERLILRRSFVQKIRLEVQRLTHIYIHAIYSPRSPGAPGRQEAEQLWRQLHWPLRLAAFAGKFITKGHSQGINPEEVGLEGEGK